MLFKKQLIEECSTSTRQLIRTICTQTQEHQAEEVATNLLLTAYLIILADNDLRPQDTSRKEDYKVIQTLVNVISQKVHQLKASLNEGTPEQSNNTEA